jgi:hypothetical protein
MEAFDGNPNAKALEGTIYFELTGDVGGDEYDGKVKGLPAARLRSWAVDRIQRILDGEHVNYDVSKTVFYIGGPTNSVGYGAIRIETPGFDSGGSFLRTGRGILHEIGHQAQMAKAGGFEPMMVTWRKELAAVGGIRNIDLVYEVPGSLEWRADQFANQYLSRLVR